MALANLIKRLKDFILRIIAAMENGQLIKQSQLQVKTNLNDLDEVLQWFEQFNLPTCVLPNLWWQYQTALVEGFTNAVRHAHRNLPPQTPIDIEVKVFTHYMEIRIWDYGQPFNLEAKLEEKLKEKLKEKLDYVLTDHGKGLILMYQLTNEMYYIRTKEDRNCLVLGKKNRHQN